MSGEVNSSISCDYAGLDLLKDSLSSSRNQVERYRSPFSKNGESLNVNPKLMNLMEPYAFKLADRWLVAVKKSDGEVEFYYIGERDADI